MATTQRRRPEQLRRRAEPRSTARTAQEKRAGPRRSVVIDLVIGLVINLVVSLAPPPRRGSTRSRPHRRRHGESVMKMTKKDFERHYKLYFGIALRKCKD